MSRETADGAGKTHGLKRSLPVLEFQRSTIYAQQARETAPMVALSPVRCGAARSRRWRTPNSWPCGPGRLAFYWRGSSQGVGATAKDCGTQYAADDFLNKIIFLGIAPSVAFVAEPQTDGVAERVNRSLKDQLFHGRIYKNLADVRVAVAEFKERYDCHWRLEKMAFMSLHDVRRAYAMQKTTGVKKRVQTIGAGACFRKHGTASSAWREFLRSGK